MQIGLDNFRHRTGSSVIVLLLLVVGCGSNSPGSSTSASSGTNDASAQFLTPNLKSSNKLATFGHEAPAKIRAEASEILTENLEARETGNFGVQCATLAKKQVQQVAEDKSAKAVKTCPKRLREEAEPLSNSKAIRTDTLDGPIAVLRVKGSRGFALFHGDDKTDYAMPMVKEGSGWKVGSILTIKLGKSQPPAG